MNKNVILIIMAIFTGSGFIGITLAKTNIDNIDTLLIALSISMIYLLSYQLGKEKSKEVIKS